MVRIIFIRGAPAVGKTTATRQIIKTLKTKHNLDCAYICEDNFRKQMQFKYRSEDLAAHRNSFELVKAVILKLMELDDYDLIFVEGLFRYKEIMERYSKFISENNFDSLVFQFELDLEEMKKRDSELRNGKSKKDIEEVKKDIDSYTPDNAIIIKTNKAVDDIVKEVIGRI